MSLGRCSIIFSPSYYCAGIFRMLDSVVVPSSMGAHGCESCPDSCAVTWTEAYTSLAQPVDVRYAKQVKLLTTLAAGMWAQTVYLKIQSTAIISGTCAYHIMLLRTWVVLQLSSHTLISSIKSIVVAFLDSHMVTLRSGSVIMGFWRILYVFSLEPYKVLTYDGQVYPACNLHGSPIQCLVCWPSFVRFMSKFGKFFAEYTPFF